MTVLHIFALFDAIDTLRIVDATLPSFSVFWGREGTDYMRNLAQVVSRLNMKQLVIHNPVLRSLWVDTPECPRICELHGLLRDPQSELQLLAINIAKAVWYNLVFGGRQEGGKFQADSCNALGAPARLQHLTLGFFGFHRMLPVKETDFYQLIIIRNTDLIYAAPPRLQEVTLHFPNLLPLEDFRESHSSTTDKSLLDWSEQDGALASKVYLRVDTAIVPHGTYPFPAIDEIFRRWSTQSNPPFAPLPEETVFKRIKQLTLQELKISPSNVIDPIVRAFALFKSIESLYLVHTRLPWLLPNTQSAPVDVIFYRLQVRNLVICSDDEAVSVFERAVGFLLRAPVVRPPLRSLWVDCIDIPKSIALQDFLRDSQPPLQDLGINVFRPVLQSYLDRGHDKEFISLTTALSAATALQRLSLRLFNFLLMLPPAPGFDIYEYVITCNTELVRATPPQLSEVTLQFPSLIPAHNAMRKPSAPDYPAVDWRGLDDALVAKSLLRVVTALLPHDTYPFPLPYETKELRVFEAFSPLSEETVIKQTVITDHEEAITYLKKAFPQTYLRGILKLMVAYPDGSVAVCDV
ncbi:hypothetical protein BD309DRAFT_880227 [Dichomitus squalens]|uniref:Uncharacterized protein n=1 Tax=Dichomitus squalens TaxID=114155 RepID=A0A4Q9P933_9APHY|nr:hypothetical protein BD309DRAFT_880227 [Dichomitus squalens]TBU62914.1 hypothetical protein BD310DRAFT_842432 [Dichomitus squalens]